MRQKQEKQWAFEFVFSILGIIIVFSILLSGCTTIELKHLPKQKQEFKADCSHPWNANSYGCTQKFAGK